MPSVTVDTDGKPHEYSLTETLRPVLQRLGEGSYTTPGDIGLELEAEGSLQNIQTPFWKTEVDGSLRNNGLEFILKKPVPFAKLGMALDEFVAHSATFKFNKSIRTSCHVHVNVQPFTFKEIYAVIGAYWLFEDILVELCGRDRVGNLFCLRATDSTTIVSSVVNSIKKTLMGWNNRFFLDFHTDSFKYSALNLCSLLRFGSIEFRSMRGIYTKGEISDWVSLLWNLVTTAKNDGSPVKIYEIFKDATPGELVDHFFGAYAPMIKAVPGWKEYIKGSSLHLAPLAYTVSKADKGEFKRPNWEPGLTIKSRKFVPSWGLATEGINTPFTAGTVLGVAPPVLNIGHSGPSKILPDHMQSVAVDGEGPVYANNVVLSFLQETMLGDA